MPGTDFSFTFNTLWQLNETEKSEVASKVTTTVSDAFVKGIVDRVTALKELSQQSRVTGVWTNITDEDIDAAAQAPPPMPAVDPATGMPIPGQAAVGVPPLPNQAAVGGPAPVAAPGGEDEFEQLHDAVRGADLTGGAPEASEGGTAKALQLKPEHEIELLAHRLHGVSLERPKGDFGINELEDIHRKVKGKPLGQVSEDDKVWLSNTNLPSTIIKDL